MRQAITTKYLPSTATQGSRIKAKASAGSITIPYDYSGNTDAVHAKAVKALAARLAWDGTWVAGGSHTEDGNVYVWVSDADITNELGLAGATVFYVPVKEA